MERKVDAVRVTDIGSRGRGARLYSALDVTLVAAAVVGRLSLVAGRVPRREYGFGDYGRCW